MRRARLVLVVMLLAATGCSSPWVGIVAATAVDPQSSAVSITLDVCHPDSADLSASSVIETSSEVRIRVSIKHPSGSEDACAVSQTIQLASPIGDRVVVDARTGSRITVSFTG